MSLQEIPLDEINLSPYNTRVWFDPEELEGLSSSIDSVGQIQPLVVRPRDGRYELVAGERRYKALKDGGYGSASCVVRALSDEEAMMFQWDENEEREGYSDYEKALKLKQIQESRDLTQEQLSEIIGKNQSYVSRILKMTELGDFMPVGINQELKNRFLYAISESQARAILGSGTDYVERILAKCLEEFEDWGSVPSMGQIESIKYSLEATDYQRKVSEALAEADKVHAEDPSWAGDPDGESLETYESDQVVITEEPEVREVLVTAQSYENFESIWPWWWSWVQDAMEHTLTHFSDNYILSNLQRLKDEDASNEALHSFLRQMCSNHGHSGPREPTMKGTSDGVVISFMEPEWSEDLEVRVTWGGLFRKAEEMLSLEEQLPEHDIEDDLAETAWLKGLKEEDEDFEPRYTKYYRVIHTFLKEEATLRMVELPGHSLSEAVNVLQGALEEMKLTEVVDVYIDGGDVILRNTALYEEQTRDQVLEGELSPETPDPILGIEEELEAEAQEETVYDTIHGIYRQYPEPDQTFLRGLLKNKHGLSEEEASRAISSYKQGEAKAPEPRRLFCPICGQKVGQRHVDVFESVLDMYTPEQLYANIKATVKEARR